MNNAKFGDGSGFEEQVDRVWPTDLVAIETPIPPPTDVAAIEKNLPPRSGHQKWRTIEGKRYYLPGEVCDPIGKNWFFVRGDLPRSDESLAAQYQRRMDDFDFDMASDSTVTLAAVMLFEMFERTSALE